MPDSSGARGGSRGPLAGFVLAAAVVAMLPLVLLAPALLPGHVLSSADVLMGSYLFASDRPPGFEPANALLTDPVQQMIPWRTLETSELRAGRMPFWNPYAYAGSPLLGNSQSAAFDPLSLPYLLTARTSGATVWVALLRAFLAGFGTLLLARRLGRSPAAAALAGLAYGCGGFMTVWLLYPHASSAAWFPWALLAAEHLARSARVVSVKLVSERRPGMRIEVSMVGSPTKPQEAPRDPRGPGCAAA